MARPVSWRPSLAGALATFLWSNRPPARIYLGDGGSYLLGAAMSVLLAYAWGVGVAVSTGVIALALLAVPVAEVACAIVRRRRGKRPLLAGDRAHPYDLLVARGWTRTAASAAYIALEVMIVVVVSIVVGAGVASIPVALGIDVAVAMVVLGSAALVGGFSDPAESDDMTRVFLSPPDVGDEERRMLLEAFDSNWIAPIGPDIDAFESEIAERIGVDARCGPVQRNGSTAPRSPVGRSRAWRRGAGSILHLHRERCGSHVPRGKPGVHRLLGRQLESGPGSGRGSPDREGARWVVFRRP